MLISGPSAHSKHTSTTQVGLSRPRGSMTAPVPKVTQPRGAPQNTKVNKGRGSKRKTPPAGYSALEALQALRPVGESAEGFWILLSRGRLEPRTGRL